MAISARTTDPIAASLDCLRGHLPPGSRVIVFGSQARGEARDDSDLDLLAGAIGAAGTAAVGAGAAVAVVDKTTHAWIDDGASATALGKAAATQVASGNFGVSYAATSAGAGEVAAPGITPSNGKDSLAGGSAALGSTRSSACQGPAARPSVHAAHR